MIKAIILDFDGVVLESVDIKTGAFRELFSRYIENVEDVVNYHLANNGISRFIKFKYIWENMLGKKYDIDTENMLSGEFSKIIFEKVSRCPFVKGASEFLEDIYDKVPIYIASAAPLNELSMIVKKRGIEKYFRGIYGTPYKKKDVIKLVINKEHAKSDEIVYVGDSIEDWNAAKSEGIVFVARRNQENLGDLGVPVYSDMSEVNSFLQDVLFADVKKKVFVGQYLKLINDLTARYHSRAWFSTFTASKSRHASNLFSDLCDVIFDKKDYSGRKSGFSYKRFFLISCIRILRMWYRICLSRILFFRIYNNIIYGDSIYLIRTGFYTKSVDAQGNYHDSFFGILPAYLKKKEKHVLIIGSVFSNRYLNTVSSIKRVKRDTVLPQECFASFLDPVKIFFFILKNRIKIKESIYLMGQDITEIVRYHVNRDFSDNVFEQLFSFYVMKHITRRFTVETYLSIYENNPWQTMALDAFKTYSPLTRTIGYQHTIVSLARLPLMIGEDEKILMPLPDKIVTNGSVTKAQLIKYGNLPEKKLEEGCALRFNVDDIIAKAKFRTSRDIKTILVALAGSQQSAAVFNLAYKTFKDKNKYRIIIREHPGFSLEKMRNYLMIQPESLPSHFVISRKNKAENDLAKSDLVLYDESSLCLYSMLMGTPCVYINRDPILLFDPMFECDFMKREAKTEEDILDAVQYFSTLSEDQFRSESMKAKSYIESYLNRVTEDKLKVFLNE